jgi:type III secretion protein C
VPFLSKLPVVGSLFKNKQDQKQKFRRLFLLTPRIVTPT